MIESGAVLLLGGTSDIGLAIVAELLAAERRPVLLAARATSPRLAQARALMRHPRVKITDLEAHLGTRYTAATIRRLKARYPGVRFVWLMGADNLVQFHRWQDWEGIMRMVPVAVLGRPGSVVRGQMSRAARIYAAERVPPGAAGDLGRMQPPVWAFADIPLSDLSSSAIRARGEWGG